MKKSESDCRPLPVLLAIQQSWPAFQVRRVLAGGEEQGLKGHRPPSGLDSMKDKLEYLGSIDGQQAVSQGQAGICPNDEIGQVA